MARRTHRSQRLSVQFEQQRSCIASRDLEFVLRHKRVSLASFHAPIENEAGIGFHSNASCSARFYLEFEWRGSRECCAACGHGGGIRTA
jgi:hypothetical protein